MRKSLFYIGVTIIIWHFWVQILCSSTLYNNAKVVDQISNLVAIANSNIFPPNSFYINPVLQWAPITEMVPELICAPNFFDPRMKIIDQHFHTGTKFFGAQISQGPILWGIKFLGDKIKTLAQVRSGTISVTALWAISISASWW